MAEQSPQSPKTGTNDLPHLIETPCALRFKGKFVWHSTPVAVHKQTAINDLTAVFGNLRLSVPVLDDHQVGDPPCDGLRRTKSCPALGFE